MYSRKNCRYRILVSLPIVTAGKAELCLQLQQTDMFKGKKWKFFSNHFHPLKKINDHSWVERGRRKLSRGFRERCDQHQETITRLLGVWVHKFIQLGMTVLLSNHIQLTEYNTGLGREGSWIHISTCILCFAKCRVKGKRKILWYMQGVTDQGHGIHVE